LLKRNETLIADDYHSQVLVEEDFVPFFVIDDDRRRLALRKSEDGGFVTKDGLLSFSRDELLEIARLNPERLSPNALLRPVVQDFVFPTVCYVGGAAEIAYFAQNSVIYDLLERPVTPVRHRAAFTLLRAKDTRTMSAYELAVSDLFKGQSDTLRMLAEKRADKNTIELLDSAEEQITEFARKFEFAFKDLDAGLTQNLKKRERKIRWHLDSLKEKFFAAESRRDSDLHRRVSGLFGFAFPKNGLQERTLTFIDMLNLFGPKVLDTIYDRISDRETDHKVMTI
jgi:uncharacterized protein YllA (UPF0747 family)